MELIKNRPGRWLVWTLLVLAVGLTSAAGVPPGRESKITLKGRTVTIGEAFGQIEAQTGLVIAYSTTKIDLTRSVTLPAASGTIRELLTRLLDGSGQTYEVKGEYIILRPAPRPRPAAPKPVEEPLVTAPVMQGVAIPAVTRRMALTPIPEPEPELQRPASGGYAVPRQLNGTPVFALKNNILADAIGTINLSGEVRTGRKGTLDLTFGLNPWTWDKEQNTKWKYMLFQPEMRWWTCEAFNGHFFGLHAHVAYFNVGGLPDPPFSQAMHDYRYQGLGYGVGISYGYQWIIAPRWGLEGNIGAGWVRLDYKKYPCQTCGKQLSHQVKDYFGPTRLGLSLVYYF